MTNSYPSVAVRNALAHIAQQARRTKPGTPVPAQWCDMHGIVVTDDDLRRNHQGDEWCPAAEDDADQGHCRLLPLVVGS